MSVLRIEVVVGTWNRTNFSVKVEVGVLLNEK